MNSSRYIFYFLICLFVSIIDVLRGLGEESFSEAVEHVPVTLLVTFAFTLSVYYIRLLVLKKSRLKEILLKEKSFGWFIYTATIITKAFLFTFIITLIAQLYAPDYTSYSIKGLFFWVSFTAIFCIILFVYVIEAFLEAETEKKGVIIKLNEIENERMVAKYQSLKNQLNPHFLFNSFNSLSALMHIDINKADHFLQELSNVYRYNLRYSEEFVVPLEKELQLIKSYMSLQNIRFREGVEITYKIDAEKLFYLLPPMTLELLIENAIKHNILEKVNPLKITVITSGDYIFVENNFQPRNTAVNNDTSLGIGLKNLKNQYELIHTEKPVFKIEDEKYIAKIPLILPSI